MQIKTLLEHNFIQLRAASSHKALSVRCRWAYKIVTPIYKSVLYFLEHINTKQKQNLDIVLLFPK